jgi:hypothetical protein
VVGALEQLCRTLEHPLQIVVQVRRLVVDDHVDADSVCADHRLYTVARALHDADRVHRKTMLRATPAFRRTVLVIPTAPLRDTTGERPIDRSVRRVLDVLSAAGLEGVLLDGDDLAKTIAEAWGSAGNDAASVATRPRWDSHVRHARSGSILYRGIALRRFPGVPVQAGWLYPLIHVRTDCDIAIHLVPVSVGEAMASLGRRLRDLHADRLVEIDRDAIGDATLEAGLMNLLELRSRLARNQSGSVRVSITATARARTTEELDRGSSALRVAMTSTLAQAEVTHLRHLDAAITTWPLGVDRLDMTKLVDTTAAATCVPWMETLCNDPHGYALGRATSDDVPVQLDPFDVSHHANANVAVFAASGQGKSYALGLITLEAAARGVGTVIIDPEGEYQRLVHSLGGEYLRLAPGCGASLNVFDAGDRSAGTTDRDAEAVAAVVDLLSVLCGEALSEIDRAHVDAAASSALTRARLAGRPPLLGDCLSHLEATSPAVAVVLRRFTAGSLGELFNRPTSVQLDAPVIGIGLRDLKDELVPAATLIVAEWLWSLVRHQRRRRHIVFDEVGLLCVHAPLRALLVQLARRCRKYDASLVVATQNLGDLLSSDEGIVIATNPAMVMLGGHRGIETERMQRAFTLTDEQRRMLEGGSRGDFLLLAGNRRLALHVEAPELHHSLLTSAT